jgi:hypothetical protein
VERKNFSLGGYLVLGSLFTLDKRDYLKLG